MKKIDELGISPAPWSIDRWNDINDAGGYTIASVMDSEGSDKEEESANARLISAAPACYDALQRIVSATKGAVMDFPQWQKDLQKALNDAKKALAKASGEEVE